MLRGVIASSWLILLLVHCACVFRMVECHCGVLVLDLPGHRGARRACSLEQGLYTLARLQTLRHARSVDTTGVCASETASTAQVVVAALSISHGSERASRWIKLHLRRRSLMLGLVCSDLLRMHLWMLFLLLFLLLTSFSVDLGRRLHEVLYLCGTYIGCPLVEMLSRASSRNLL